MIKIEKTEVHGFEAAIRGLRNPMESWEKSDSYDAVDCGRCGLIEEKGICKKEDRPGRCDNFRCYEVGENDLKLMKKLSAAGNDHAKYLRMINVTCDITAPQFWWTEADTYKVGTVRNSCSKMHKIHVHPFKYEDFSHEGIEEVSEEFQAVKDFFLGYLSILETLRTRFNSTQNKKYWRALIEMLPEGYNMKATLQLNYQVLKTMYHARKNHKLDEWREFCKWIETLPYKELITGGTETE